MRWYDVRWFVLLSFLLLVPLAHGQDTRDDRAKLERLKVIFETQLKLVESLESDLTEVKNELQSLKELQQTDSERYESLKQTYNLLLREHERETALLQSLRGDLTASQAEVERLETSLQKAEKSLRRCWISSGVSGLIIGLLIGLIGG
jgi:multidrug resistance efflux pump